MIKLHESYVYNTLVILLSIIAVKTSLMHNIHKSTLGFETILKRYSIMGGRWMGDPGK